MNDAENKDEIIDSAQAEAETSTESNSESSIDVENENIDVEVDELTELELAQHEIAKLKDAFLRAKAEEDNVRRRAEKEVANSRKFAVEGFAKEMLNVYDSLKLATNNEPAEDADETVKSIYEGSKITLSQLNSAFAKYSLKEIAPEVGSKLDPNIHQAMSMVESEDIDPGCIITAIQSGFELHDRLLRPAMVIVAK
ncbi:nucleotide exchange factor GrpE [Arenicella sp. 4NH20-0111]|uniref:nucleotide exchange factor GrpE n=1 Tax=Arenicella sp. 4NH20-0111 TaxID=3127648 RepID=UPI00310996E2